MCAGEENGAGIYGGVKELLEEVPSGGKRKRPDWKESFFETESLNVNAGYVRVIMWGT